MQQHILIIDGHSLAHRAWHASGGAGAGPALDTFAGMLLRLLDAAGTTRVAAAFDDGRDRRRQSLWPAYKANRAAEDPAFAAAVDDMIALLRQAGAAVHRYSFVEADDVIATLARTASETATVQIASSDRDLWQLVDESISILDTAAGIGSLRKIGPQQVVEKHGVAPKAYVHMAALRGDSSDGIPGVPGVGPKRAADLICQHGDINTLYTNLDTVGTERLRGLLAEHEDAVRRNIELMRLDDTIPLEGASFGDVDLAAAATWLELHGGGRAASEIQRRSAADASPF